jgi:hypothetical protein
VVVMGASEEIILAILIAYIAGVGVGFLIAR